ncbi:helix-turn-helix domain-containing protein [Nocardiopsis sp. NPDC006938]|uniref:helix-turn-helix domain-containing protein n=1 Tax=Nocardiopsis sp. NPDC006938 TaxID=3364337 RepID=UPI003674B4EE
MTQKSPNIRRRRLGHVLRGLREEAGLTLDAAAKGAGVPRSTLGRMETAEARRLRNSDLNALADFYQVSSETREGMHGLAREAKERGWWSKYKDVFGERALPDGRPRPRPSEPFSRSSSRGSSRLRATRRRSSVVGGPRRTRTSSAWSRLG